MSISVLFVCRGNICRSPLAKAVFEHAMRARNLSHVFLSDSAGTHGDQIGREADTRAQIVASRHGLDLSSHRARQVLPADFKRFHYMIAMDTKNRDFLIRLRGHRSIPEIYNLLGFSGADNQDLKDPYRGQLEDFRLTLNTIVAALPFLIDFFLPLAKDQLSSAGSIRGASE